ncbi:hypothetical protein ACHAXN_007727 [Cyclotella atomus]
MTDTGRQRHLHLTILSFAILLRILIGIHPHSGQDDYQGPGAIKAGTATSSTKYGGDYEAQRHWMELTYHLPLSEWYYYDLSYWGLDYPPLTAYVSWFFGYIADTLGSVHGLEVLKDLMALHDSRGFENERGKMYMRFTVLVMDLLVYISAVWEIAPRLLNGTTDIIREKERIRLLTMALAQPAILLMDHGHFQYNTVSLGLALWSFHFMTMHSNPFKKDESSTSSLTFVGPILGSVLFSLALNFKQMELYHAPAVFAYLLGRCFECSNVQSTTKDNEGGTMTSMNNRNVITKFCSLGITVISSFAILWFPFAIYPRSGTNARLFHLAGVTQVLKRLFPFQRGLFEGKVANIWCALSVKPFSIRRRVPEEILPLMASGLTLMLILLPCWYLFQVGKGDRGQCDTAKTIREKDQHQSSRERADIKLLLWGCTSTSLAFFLASFQVHEKGILIPLAPLSLLLLEAPRFIAWFSIVATWTLWPLVTIDRLGSAYACCVVIFLCLHNMTRVSPSGESDVFSMIPSKYIIHLSVVAMVLLHAAELLVAPPRNLPDLFPVLWSLVGCGLISFSYLVTIWVMDKGQTKKIVGSSSSSKTKRTSKAPMIGIGILATILPASHGFVVSQKAQCYTMSQLQSSNMNEIFTSEMIERAREPLYWETQRTEDAKPILDLSKRDSDTLSLSEKAVVNQGKLQETNTVDSEDSCVKWEDGQIWLETERRLISMGVLLNETDASNQPMVELISSQTMIARAPQLIRLSTSQVIESTNFFLDQRFALASLIQHDPTILTFCADDLYYGMEYLSNMMTRGNETQALHMIRTQSVLSPQMALSLFRMGVEGGIDEGRVSNALANASAASGKAVEYAVNDAGRTYREFKQLKGGRKSLG